MREQPPAAGSDGRFLRQAAAFLAFAYFGWLILANVALNAGLVEWVVSNADGRKLRHGFAWTVWPWKIHVDDFRLRLDQHDYQLELGIPHGRIDIGMAALLGKRFHAQSIRAEGVRIYYRDKVETGSGARPPPDLYAAIAGVSEPFRPVRLPREHEDWWIDLNDVAFTVDEAWIGPYHAHGQARVTGGLELWPGHSVEIQSTYLEVDSGRIVVGSDLPGDTNTLVRHVGGRAVLALARYSTQESIEDLLARLTGSARMRLEIGDLSALDAVLPEGMGLSGGGGWLRMDGGIEDGRLTADTRVTYETDALGVRYEEIAARGGLTLRAAVQRGPDDRVRPLVSAFLREVELHHEDASGRAFVVLERAWISSGAHDADLSDGTTWSKTRVRIRDLQSTDLSRAEPLTDASFDIRGGRLHADVDALIRHGPRIELETEANLRDAGVAFGSRSLEATGDIEARGEIRPDLRLVALDKLVYSLDDVVLQMDGHENEATTVKGEHRFLRWSGEQGELETSFQITLGSMRPLLSHVSNLETALPPELLLASEEPLHIEGTLRGQGDRLDLVAERLERGDLVATGRLRKSGRHRRGAFLLLEPIALGLWFRNHSVEAELGAGREWLQRAAVWVENLDAGGATSTARNPIGGAEPR